MLMQTTQRDSPSQLSIRGVVDSLLRGVSAVWADASRSAFPFDTVTVDSGRWRGCALNKYVSCHAELLARLLLPLMILI